MWVNPKSSAAKSLKKVSGVKKFRYFFHFFEKKISEIFARRQKALFLLGLTPAAGVGRFRLQSGGGPGAVDSLKFANAHSRWALRARLFDAANSKKLFVAEV